MVDSSSSLVAKLAAADADKERKIRYEVQVRSQRHEASHNIRELSSIPSGHE